MYENMYSAIKREYPVYFAAFIFGATFSFLFFAIYLQDSVLTLRRALPIILPMYGIGGLFYFLIHRWIFTSEVNKNDRSLHAMLFFLLLSIISSPYFHMDIPYPSFPYFRRESRITIYFKVDAVNTDDRSKLNSIWLNTGIDKYDRSGFQTSGDWIKVADGYFLAKGNSAELIWSGRVGKAAILTISPLDVKGIVSIDWDGDFRTGNMDEKIIFRKKFTPPVMYIASIIIAEVIFAGLILFLGYSLYQKIPSEQNNFNTRSISLIFIYLAIYTALTQIRDGEINSRLWLQTERHWDVIMGQAQNPWQYRILTEWIIEWIRELSKWIGFTLSYGWTFLLLRASQNILIYFLSYQYFRKLGFSQILSLYGIFLLTGSFVNAAFLSDLSFNTYFDVIFYLVGGLIVLSAQFKWLPLVALLASLNRETSGFIPLLALLVPAESLNLGRKRYWSAILAFGAWLAVFLALHYFLPDNGILMPYGIQQGLPLLSWNLTVGLPYVLLFHTLGFTPILGLFVFKDLPGVIQRLFLLLIPIWIVIHLLGSVLAETRVFLVPQVMVFIPSSLVLLGQLWSKTSNSTYRINSLESI